MLLSCTKDSRLVIQNTAEASHITDRAVSIIIHHFDIIIIFLTPVSTCISVRPDGTIASSCGDINTKSTFTLVNTQRTKSHTAK